MEHGVGRLQHWRGRVKRENDGGTNPRVRLQSETCTRFGLGSGALQRLTQLLLGAVEGRLQLGGFPRLLLLHLLCTISRYHIWA